MKFVAQSIPDVLLIEPEPYMDQRGYFVETFRQDEFEAAVGFQVDFCQENESKSTQGVLRGLHFQCPPFSQSKLVRVVAGKVLCVAVDIRSQSPFYGQFVSVILNDILKQQLFMPKGFAHGFLTLSQSAIFTYKVDNYYAPEFEGGIAFNDPSLKIDWGLSEKQIRLSEKDQQWPLFKNLNHNFDINGI